MLIVPVWCVVAAAAADPTSLPCFKGRLAVEPQRDRIAVLRSSSIADVAGRAIEAANGIAADLALVVDDQAPDLPDGWIVLRRPAGAPPSTEATLANLLSTARRHPGVGFASPVFRGDGDEWRIATPDLIVRFDLDVPPGRAEALLAAFVDGDILDRDAFGLANAFRVRLRTADAMAALDIADTLSTLDAVRFAELDMLMSAWPALPPSDDPLFPQQWALENTGQSPTPCSSTPGTPDIDMDVPAAWTTTIGDPALVVLVIDNGVQFDHPDLQADPALGFDATGESGAGWPVHPCDDHGTAVAGVIAALGDNAIGTTGIAPLVQIASARISTVNSTCSSWTIQGSWVAAAMQFGLDIGARITNTSYTFPTSALIDDAYANADNLGVLHLVAAGNGGAGQLLYPAKLPSVMAVSAITNKGLKAGFSSFGPGLALAAPGVDVLTADRTGSEGYSLEDTTCFNGTSAASPCAAGVAALALSANPALTNNMLRTILRRTATNLGAPGYDTTFGWGLPNAALAVDAALRPADLDLDGDVDGADVGLLIAAWGTSNPVGDIDGNGVVDAIDLGLVLAGWTA